jgi:hypothetical protein
MQQVSESLVATLAPLAIERHLNALPFAVLLENIAGLMAPRLAGRAAADAAARRARPERLVELRRGALSTPRCRRSSRTA